VTAVIIDQRLMGGWILNRVCAADGLSQPPPPAFRSHRLWPAV